MSIPTQTAPEGSGDQQDPKPEHYLTEEARKARHALTREETALARAAGELDKRRQALTAAEEAGDDAGIAAAQKRVAAAENKVEVQGKRQATAEKNLAKAERALKQYAYETAKQTERQALGLVPIGLPGVKDLYFTEATSYIMSVRTVVDAEGNWKEETQSLYWMPTVAARVSRPTHKGAPTGLSYLLKTTDAFGVTHSATVTQDDINKGRWADHIGRPHPTGKSLSDAAAWVIREYYGPKVPECSSLVTRHPEGGIILPDPEVAFGGYGTTRGEEAPAWDAWREILGHARRSPKTALVLGAWTGAMFVAELELPTHVLNGNGKKQQGKSTLQKVCACMVGDADPEDSSQEILKSWNSSPQGIPNMARQARYFPFAREEVSSARLPVLKMEGYLSAIVAGADRTVANAGGQNNLSIGPFRSMLLSTSNLPLRRTGQTEDLAARLYEIEAPFWTSDFVDPTGRLCTEETEGAVLVPERVERLAKMHGGWPLRWIDTAGHLQGEGCNRWVREHAALVRELAPGATGLARTHARVLACWVIGARILEDTLKVPGLADSAMEAAREYLAESVDIADSLYKAPGDKLLTELQMRTTDLFRFPRLESIKDIDGEIHGWWDSDNVVNVLVAAQEKICADAGIENETAAIHDLHQREILKKPATKNWSWDLPRNLRSRLKGRAYRYDLTDCDTVGPADGETGSGDGPADPAPETGLPACCGYANGQPCKDPLTFDPDGLGIHVSCSPLCEICARPITEAAGTRARKHARCVWPEPTATIPEQPQEDPPLPPALPPTRDVATVPRQEPVTRSVRRSRPTGKDSVPSARTSGWVCIYGPEGLTAPDGQAVPVDGDTLADALHAAVVAAPAGTVAQVLVDPAANAKVGIRGRLPRPKKEGQEPPEPAFVAALRAAGWGGRSKTGAVPVRAWNVFQHPDHPEAIVHVIVRHWLNDKDGGALWGTKEEASEVWAARIARVGELLGNPWGPTPGKSATDLHMSIVRDKSLRRYGKWPIWQAPGEDWQKAAPSAANCPNMLWTTEEADDFPHHHQYDARYNYLSSYDERRAMDPLTHTGAIPFTKTLDGVWILERPEWTHPNLPAPWAAMGGNSAGEGPLEVTTPVAVLMQERSLPVVVLDSWTAERHEMPGGEEFVARVRDALKVAEAEEAHLPKDQRYVTSAVKQNYRCLYTTWKRGPFPHRPDWCIAVKTESACRILRKIYAVADATGRTPLKIDVDGIVYGSQHEDPLADVPPLNGDRPVIGDGLGQFKEKRGMI